MWMDLLMLQFVCGNRCVTFIVDLHFSINSFGGENVSFDVQLENLPT